MMIETVRIWSQWLAFLISLFIMVVAGLAMYLRPDKRWTLFAWLVYGFVGAAFYVAVLFSDLGLLAREISPIRVLIQDTLVASMIFAASMQDFRDWWVKWKR